VSSLSRAFEVSRFNILLSKRILEGLSDFYIFCGKKKEIVIASLITLGIQTMIILRIVFLFRAVGVDLALLTIIWIGSLIFIIQILPISFAGLGVRESAFAYAFVLYGLNPEAGALVGILFFGQLVINACFGGVLEFSDRGNFYALKKPD